MTTRIATTAADLFVLLEKEFRRRRPKGCEMCFVQLPFRIDVRDGHAANWEVLLPPQCGYGCDMVLEELVGEFQARYELSQPSRVDLD